jgi:nitrate reductase NapAB chaperone NapD
MRARSLALAKQDHPMPTDAERIDALEKSVAALEGVETRLRDSIAKGKMLAVAEATRAVELVHRNAPSRGR